MLSFLTDKTYAYIPTFQDERQGCDPQKSVIKQTGDDHVSYLTTVNSLFPSACTLKQGGGGTRLSLTWARLLNSKPLAHGSSSSCDQSCDSNSSHKQNVSAVQGKLQALSTSKRDKHEVNQDGGGTNQGLSRKKRDGWQVCVQAQQTELDATVKMTLPIFRPWTFQHNQKAR